ncbi:MAG: glycosyltransferase family 4 protein [Dictyoglomaceae bacterium]
MILYLTFFLSLIISVILTPIVRKRAFEMGALDYPAERRVHSQPTPRIGGVAFYLAILIVNLLFNRSLMIEKVLLGGTLIFFVGLLDDFIELKPTPKFWLTFLAVLIAIFIGIRLETWRVPYTNIIISGWLAYILSFLWLFGLTNAMNFIDGLDGLAAGVSAISSFSLLIISLLLGRTEAVIFLSTMLGGILGFLFFNFPPASIFMGDSGAMFLGFVLSAISIVGVLKFSTLITLLVPILILGFPILDTLFSIIRRLAEGRAPWKFDKDHIHHRFLRIGMDTKQSIGFIYLINISMSLIAIILALSYDIEISLLVLIGTLSLIIFILAKLEILEVRRNGKV